MQPVDVDTFRIAVGETYDVIIEPREDRAYTIEAQSIDRRGFARATLAPRDGMQGPLPEMRKPALLTMADMGMADMGMGDMPGMDMSGMDHSKMGHAMPASPLPVSFAQAPPVDGPAGEKVLGYADLKRLDHAYPLPEPSRTGQLPL